MLFKQYDSKTWRRDISLGRVLAYVIYKGQAEHFDLRLLVSATEQVSMLLLVCLSESGFWGDGDSPGFQKGPSEQCSDRFYFKVQIFCYRLYCLARLNQHFYKSA